MKQIVKPNSIAFDVMSEGRFIDTMVMPLTQDLIKEKVDGIAVWDYKKINERAEALVVKKRPSLKYKKFNIIAQ